MPLRLQLIRRQYADFIFVPLQECHCMLFLTQDNSFRGDDTSISLDEVVEATQGMSGVQP